MRRSVCFFSSLTLAFAGLLFTTSDAHAQAATPPADGVAPATPAPAAGGAPAAGAAAKDPDHEEGRLRIGFNFLNAGIGTGGNLSGPMFGATFKIGYQLNRLMGVYGNISPFVWVGSSDQTVTPGGASVDIGAIAGTQLTPVFSLTPVDIFEVAAGPSLDYLTGGGVSTNVAGTSAGGFSSVYFGLHGKVALHLGGRNEETGRRKGFTIEGNVHPTFAEGSTLTFFTVGLGYDWM